MIFPNAEMLLVVMGIDVCPTDIKLIVLAWLIQVANCYVLGLAGTSSITSLLKCIQVIPNHIKHVKHYS